MARKSRRNIVKRNVKTDALVWSGGKNQAAVMSVLIPPKRPRTPYLRHLPRIDEKPDCINSVLKKQKKKLDSSYISFCGAAIQEHNRRVQLRTYALPNHFQKQLNSPFLIDQKMILAKIQKTRRFTVLRLMPPLKGTAPNLHTIHFILTEHALFSFYLLWYLFFLSLYSKAIS